MGYTCDVCGKEKLRFKERKDVCLECFKRFDDKTNEPTAEELVDNANQNLCNETKKLMSAEDLDLLNALPKREETN